MSDNDENDVCDENEIFGLSLEKISQGKDAENKLYLWKEFNNISEENLTNDFFYDSLKGKFLNLNEFKGDNNKTKSGSKSKLSKNSSKKIRKEKQLKELLTHKKIEKKVMNSNSLNVQKPSNAKRILCENNLKLSQNSKHSSMDLLSELKAKNEIDSKLLSPKLLKRKKCMHKSLAKSCRNEQFTIYGKLNYSKLNPKEQFGIKKELINDDSKLIRLNKSYSLSSASKVFINS